MHYDLVQAATSTRTAPLFSFQELEIMRVKLYGPTGFYGVVTRIATALDPATRTMRIEIDLPNPDENLLPGMFAQVTLSFEFQQDPPKP